MDYFVWDERYAIGREEIDRQHEYLIGILNRLGNLVARQGAFSAADIDAVCHELDAYTQYHFHEEESLMRRMGVDLRHIEQHKQAHLRFLGEIPRLRKTITPDDISTATPLLSFLTHWLVYHILGADQSMARQVTAIEAGQTPEDAYRPEKREHDQATGSLLKSLNSLFDQLCARNQELKELNATLERRVEERTLALVEANAEMARMIRRLEDEMQESRRLSAELAQANHDLTHVARTDPLTGLANRRHALHLLAALWENEAMPLSCILIDADGFKRINDDFGHDAGDAVLRELAHRLRDSVRTDDVVCRLGGDEFLIICPATPACGALHLAEKVRTDVSALRVRVGAMEWAGSVSGGVSSRQTHFRHYEEMIKSADTALYAAKRKGRNCVEYA